MKDLALKGLGYCCLWAFFTVNKRTGMIATRLGVDSRTIRWQKAKFKAGDMACEKCSNCLKRKGVV